MSKMIRCGGSDERVPSTLSISFLFNFLFFDDITTRPFDSTYDSTVPLVYMKRPRGACVTIMSFLCVARLDEPGDDAGRREYIV